MVGISIIPRIASHRMAFCLVNINSKHLFKTKNKLILDSFRKD